MEHFLRRMKVFEEKQEIAEAVEAIYRVSGELDRGDVLTHLVISEILNLKPHEGRWDHILVRVRRRLLQERGIATWPEREVGYRLVTRQEQIDLLPRLRLRKSLRQIRKSRSETQALPVAEATVHQRQLRSLTLDLLAEHERKARESMRIQKMLSRPTIVQPRRPVIA